MYTKILKYIMIVLSGMGLLACSDDSPVIAPPESSSGPAAVVDGDQVTFYGSLDIASLKIVETRSLSSHADLDDIHLYLVEFSDEGGPLINNYLRTYEAQEETQINGVVKFKVTLRATTLPRVLHLIALPSGESLHVNGGIEAAVIPSLTTADGVDAYWRRLRFPTGYCVESGGGEWEVDPELINRLSGVILIRNFGKIAVRNEAPEFTLQGFEVINTAAKGSIAPWNTKTHSFPDFFDDEGNIRDFIDLTDEYEGYLPVNTSTLNQVSESAVPDVFSLSEKYLYERPLNPTERTFVIIKGLYKGTVNYYKIDIGRNDSNGIFRYFHLIRNYSFNIIIKSVNAAGYSTPSEAANGSVYNNISFDIDLSHLMNMSDGKEIVYVNYTTKVLTSPNEQTIDFQYRYVDISSGKNNNSNVRLVGLEPGSVIKSVGSNQASGYFRRIPMVIYPATPETRMQTFAVVKPSTGLGRQITLILHSKWDLDSVRTYPTRRYDWGKEENVNMVPKGMSKPFTLFFDIPNNLPEAVFPLDFIIESQQQVIENEPGVGYMDVKWGASLFGTGQTLIQYHKQITWTQYNNWDIKLDENGVIGGVLYYDDDGKEYHRVACHFRNTMALTGGAKYRIAIRNDNFEDYILTVTSK